MKGKYSTPVIACTFPQGTPYGVLFTFHGLHKRVVLQTYKNNVLSFQHAQGDIFITNTGSRLFFSFSRLSRGAEMRPKNLINSQTEFLICF